LVQNLPHRVYLHEPTIKFNKIKNMLGRFQVDPSIFIPVGSESALNSSKPTATLDVQTPIAVHLKRIDNYGHVYYIVEITTIPLFGLVPSSGPSSFNSCGWYMGKFTLEIKDARVASTIDLFTPSAPKLYSYEYEPTNEIGGISVSSSTGWNASAGPTLGPAPPFASLSATVGFSDERSSTTKMDNLQCTYLQLPAPTGVPITSWQIELAYFLRRLHVRDKIHTPKIESFYWSNSTPRTLSHIPKEAMRLLKKKFMQSYMFEETTENQGGRYSFEFIITATAYGFHSGHPGDGNNILYVYENGTTQLKSVTGTPERIAAVQRTRVRVDLVPSKMEITVTKIPFEDFTVSANAQQ